MNVNLEDTINYYLGGYFINKPLKPLGAGPVCITAANYSRYPKRTGSLEESVFWRLWRRMQKFDLYLVDRPEARKNHFKSECQLDTC